MVYYELNCSSFFFFFSRFNHISIEPSNDTTRTQMYLLSVTVYYDPTFYYNLAKKTKKQQPPSLLLSLSQSSLLMCSLRGPTRPAGGSRRHLQWNAHPPTRSPSLLDPRHFYHGLCLILFLLKMWTAPSRDSSDCSSSPSDQCSILVAFCDISWICGCIYTELLFLSWIMLCLLPFHFFF